MKKNKITVISGTAKLLDKGTIEVTSKDGAKKVTAGAFIIATGGRPRQFPHLPTDGKNVFNYREAMSLPAQPKSLLCIGAGAIGMEFGYFYATLGTEVHVVEVMDQVLPVEDAEVAKIVDRQFQKAGVKIHVSTKVTKLEVKDGAVTVHLDKGGKAESITVEKVLVSVGIVANTEGIGLETVGVKLDERGFIAVDEHCQTSVPGIYAIGDCAGRQLLAHKASFEGEAAVGHLVGHPAPVNYAQVPGCTYCQPQVASVGLTERKAKELGRPLKIGKFQFMASGKAKAIGHPEGFVKLIFDAEYDQLIGAHLVGYDATELLAELGLAMKLECTAREIMETMHAHPTLSEAVMEAAADALGQCVHQ
jgi:dihydrolipoamide dehydrogenase